MDKIKKALRAAAVAALVGLQLAAVLELHQIAESMPEVYECAACGAHVTEAWHTEDANGETVHICRRCADLLD